MKRIAVVGTGYVGLTTGACFAELGNDVVCVDISQDKIDSLLRGETPFFEPGLGEMVTRNVAAGRLAFTTNYAETIPTAEIVFIAVGTPTGPDGRANLKYVRAAAETIGAHLHGRTIIVNKSTVPIGTGDWVGNILRRSAPAGTSFSVVSNPEFVAEGTAVADFMAPDRVVLGGDDLAAVQEVASLYLALQAPFISVDLRTAEMIKYASNAFLATKVSFINEIASICERLGADVNQVSKGMGLDQRIGKHFLKAGLGYGGSCFPKDVRALAQMADYAGCHPQLLRTVMEINSDQRATVIDKVRQGLGGSLKGARIALLGLAFKPNTDDMREAPSLTLVERFVAEGATVAGYDPQAGETARALLDGQISYAESAYEAVEEADAAVLVTEWPEFRALDLKRVKGSMRGDVFVDGRNLYEPEALRSIGFNYFGIGRGYAPRPFAADADDLYLDSSAPEPLPEPVASAATVGGQ